MDGRMFKIQFPKGSSQFIHWASAILMFFFALLLPYWLGANFNMTNIPANVINLLFAFFLSGLIWLTLQIFWFGKDDRPASKSTAYSVHIDSKDMSHIKFADMDAKQIKAYFDGWIALVDKTQNASKSDKDKPSIKSEQ